MSAGTDALRNLSDELAGLTARTAGSVVGMHGGRRGHASGILWGDGVVVTAEEALECDEDLRITLPDGREVEARLAGRDPCTDIAVLRFESGAPAPRLEGAGALKPGQLALAVGRRRESVIARLGVVAAAGGEWRSRRGGRIDSLIELDLALEWRAEGGALVDAEGRFVGMAVFGSIRRTLVIPAATIERVAGQLLARGRIARGYLGAALQPIRLDGSLARRMNVAEGRGAIIVNLDPDGPGERAGLLVGDVVTTWNGQPVRGVRDLIGRLDPDSVGQTVDLGLLRAGAPASASVTIGERPAS